jgi:hypothetical protein
MVDRTPDDLVAAITQIREFAANYKGKRQAFFDALYLVLATPIPEGEHYNATVRRMYLAAIGALTSEIQPPSAETYGEVVKRLKLAIGNDDLGEISFTIEADPDRDSAYRPVDRDRGENKVTADNENQRQPRSESLRETLPPRRRLTRRNQTLVDSFREEIPSVEHPFRRGGVQRG